MPLFRAGEAVLFCSINRRPENPKTNIPGPKMDESLLPLPGFREIRLNLPTPVKPTYTAPFRWAKRRLDDLWPQNPFPRSTDRKTMGWTPPARRHRNVPRWRQLWL